MYMDSSVPGSRCRHGDGTACSRRGCGRCGQESCEEGYRLLSNDTSHSSPHVSSPFQWNWLQTQSTEEVAFLTSDGCQLVAMVREQQSLTFTVQARGLLKVDDVECVSGCGLHVGYTEVVPLYMPLRVEVRVQDEGVVMTTTAVNGEAIIYGSSTLETNVLLA